MKILVIGGGIAGMSCALQLKSQGDTPLILERSDRLGGNVRNWYKLFPTFTSSAEVWQDLIDRVEREQIEVRTLCHIVQVDRRSVTTDGGERIEGDGVVLCTGYDLFDARRKEEYGYGVYDNVFTSVDIEQMFREGRVSKADGSAPKRIAFLHCVGSRDEKVGNRHCSKVCCITGVKQAVEMRQLFPECEIYNFYMDIRMFGSGYEELYRKAQIESNIHFIRGRISEASPTFDGRIQIKAEDTLVGRPLNISVDMLILLVGMEGGADNRLIARCKGVEVADNGFIAPHDPFAGNVVCTGGDVWCAGAVTAPKSVGESIDEGIAAAAAIRRTLCHD